jgi:niacin transporter
MQSEVIPVHEINISRTLVEYMNTVVFGRMSRMGSTWRLSNTQLALSAVLSALAFEIPFIFRGTPLQLNIPAIGYTATAASHVPSMLAIAIGPSVAAIVGLASTFGFLFTLGPVIAVRASTHVLWGVAASVYFFRNGSYLKSLILVALPIHAVAEGLVVYILLPAFGGANVVPEVAGFSVFLGTIVHHLVDSAISLSVYRIVKPMLLPLTRKKRSP